MAEAANPVTFPDDYPNSVKHFLLMGCVGFALGSLVFLGMTLTRGKPSVTHSLTFLYAAVGAMAYYAMWTGLGVSYKTTDQTPRVIFWGRYLEQGLTQPLLLINLCYMAKLQMGSLVSLVGMDIILVLASAIGAFEISPMKYMWWFSSVCFTILLVIQIVPTTYEAHLTYKILAYGLIACFGLFNVLWLCGSEGSASLGLSQEVGIYTVVDLVCKIGFGLYFILNHEVVMGEEDGYENQKLSSQQYV